jgi:hypothetical protein
MSNSRKIIIVVPILVFILACGLLSSPIQKVEDTAATAAAFATQAGGVVTQVQGMVTDVVPLETLMAVSTTDPNQPVGNPFDPKAPPLETWKGIPVMPQATAGEEAEGMYGYKIDATPEKITSFYVTRLIGDGWVESFSMPYADGMGLMMFTKGSQTLNVTLSEVNGYMLVLLNLQ